MNQYCFYWSPTGGTQKAAEIASEGWGGDFIPVDLLKSDQKLCLEPEDLCLFAVPSYGGRVPGPCMEKLKLLTGNGTMAVLMVVFGNRAIDDTLLELSDGVKSRGFRPIAAMEAVAQHSLVPKYGAGRPDQQDRLEIKEFAQKIRRAVEEKDRKSVV